MDTPNGFHRMSQSGQELRGETAKIRQQLDRDGTSHDTVGDTPPPTSRNNKRRRIIVVENEALVVGHNSYATPVDEVGYKKGGKSLASTTSTYHTYCNNGPTTTMHQQQQRLPLLVRPPSHQHCTNNQEELLMEMEKRRLKLKLSTNIQMLVQFQDELDRLISTTNTTTRAAAGNSTASNDTCFVQSQDEPVVPKRRADQAEKKKEDAGLSSHEEYNSFNFLRRRSGCPRDIKTIQARTRHIQTPRTNEQEEGPRLQTDIGSDKNTTALLSRREERETMNSSDMSIKYNHTSASRNDVTSNHHYYHHQRRVFDQGKRMVSAGADIKGNEINSYNLLKGSEVRERVNLLVTKTQNLLKTIQLDQRSLLSNLLLLTSSQDHGIHDSTHNTNDQRRRASTSSFSSSIDAFSQLSPLSLTSRKGGSDTASLSHYHPLNQVVGSTCTNHPTVIGGGCCVKKTPHNYGVADHRGVLDQHHECPTNTTEYQRAGVPFPLATKEDEAYFSNFMCFVRAQFIEVFEASEMDVQRRKTSRPVKLNQVGIRCRFCSHLKQKKPHATQYASFPPSLERLYHGVAMMTCKHFTNCSEVPNEIRQKYDYLKKLSKKSGGNKNIQYWVITSKMKGLVDTPPELKLGIRLLHRE